MEKEQNNNMTLQDEHTGTRNPYKVKIATLEAELENRDREIQGLRAAIAKIPEYVNIRSQTCFKIPENEDGEDKVVIIDIPYDLIFFQNILTRKIQKQTSAFEINVLF